VYGDVSVNGKVAATDAYLFTLNGATLKPADHVGQHRDPDRHPGRDLPGRAPLLDSTFKTSAVKAGLLVGIATITVNTTPGQ